MCVCVCVCRAQRGKGREWEGIGLKSANAIHFNSARSNRPGAGGGGGEEGGGERLIPEIPKFLTPATLLYHKAIIITIINSYYNLVIRRVS